MFNFKEWYYQEAKRLLTLNPNVKQRFGSLDKLKKELDDLNAILKAKEKEKEKVEPEPEKEEKPELEKPEDKGKDKDKKPGEKPEKKPADLEKKDTPQLEPEKVDLLKKKFGIKKKEDEGIKDVKKKQPDIQRKPSQRQQQNFKQVKKFD